MSTHSNHRRRWTRDDLHFAVIAITPTVVMAVFWGLVLLAGGGR